jgi:tellurite resistance protein TerC
VAAADVPAWAWTAFAGFVLAVLALDLFVLHRRAREVSLAEAGAWSAVWVALGLGFGGLLWWWQGSGTGQAYLAGYLIEKSLSVDNILVFAFIFSALQIPPRYQQRVLMLGILAALVMRGAFIAGGVTLLDRFHPVIYFFGAVLLYAAIRMLRGGIHPQPERNLALRGLRRILPTADRLHGQRFLVRDGGRVLATPLLLALIMVETTDVIFAVDSIPAVLAVSTDMFVVFTSNVFALLGMRALYFLLAASTARVRYLQPALAVILAAVAVKMLLADLYEFPVWASPAFIAAVLAAAGALSLRAHRRSRPTPGAPPVAATPPGTDGRHPAPVPVPVPARDPGQQGASTLESVPAEVSRAPGRPLSNGFTGRPPRLSAGPAGRTWAAARPGPSPATSGRGPRHPGAAGAQRSRRARRSRGAGRGRERGLGCRYRERVPWASSSRACRSRAASRAATPAISTMTVQAASRTVWRRGGAVSRAATRRGTGPAQASETRGVRGPRTPRTIPATRRRLVPASRATWPMVWATSLRSLVTAAACSSAQRSTV